MDTEKPVRNNGLITDGEFAELARVHDLRCTSIYLPTDRAGQDVIRGQGQLRMKNCLKEIRHKLAIFLQ